MDLETTEHSKGSVQIQSLVLNKRQSSIFRIPPQTRSHWTLCGRILEALTDNRPTPELPYPPDFTLTFTIHLLTQHHQTPSSQKSPQSHCILAETSRSCSLNCRDEEQMSSPQLTLLSHLVVPLILSVTTSSLVVDQTRSAIRVESIAKPSLPSWPQPHHQPPEPRWYLSRLLWMLPIRNKVRNCAVHLYHKKSTLRTRLCILLTVGQGCYTHLLT